MFLTEAIFNEIFFTFMLNIGPKSQINGERAFILIRATYR